MKHSEYFFSVSFKYCLQFTMLYDFLIEHVLAVTPQNAPIIRPPASHHENYPS